MEVVTIENNNAILNSYASGSGAISFVWVDKYDRQRKALNTPITAEDLKQWMKAGDNAKRWKSYIISEFHTGHAQLVPNVKRIAENVIEFEGHEYRYEPVFHEDGKIWRPSTKVFGYSFGKEVELINHGLRATLLFFLENENYTYKSLQP